MVAIKMKMPRKCADCRFAQRHYDEWYWCAAECRNMKKAELSTRQNWCPLIEVAAVAPVLPEMTVTKKFS